MIFLHSDFLIAHNSIIKSHYKTDFELHFRKIGCKSCFRNRNPYFDTSKVVASVYNGRITKSS